MIAWENGSPKGQIRSVLGVIFNSKLFRSQAGVLQKIKTPLEFAVSAIRALRAPLEDGRYTAETDGRLQDALNRMGGMRLFDRAEPDGYPEAAAPWISAGTLAERLRFVQALLIRRGQSGRGDAGNSYTDPVALIQKKVPPVAWTDAAAISDFFLGLLFPGEGRANLVPYRASAINFLNTADDGESPAPFNALSTSSTAYDTRVRGVVAVLLTFPRFQEQ
jgi:hypothetical protein